MVKLIKGNWYKLDNWIFKLDRIEGNKVWNTLSSTPYDNYTSKNEGYLPFYNIKDIKPITNFSDVYRLFPEEKIKNKVKIYELW